MTNNEGSAMMCETGETEGSWVDNLRNMWAEADKTHKNIETVKRIDFDRLDMLASERIGALKLYAQNIDKADGGEEVHDAICRDLILPCIYTLTQFLEAVKLDETQQWANFSERRKVSDGEASE